MLHRDPGHDFLGVVCHGHGKFPHPLGPLIGKQAAFRGAPIQFDGHFAPHFLFPPDPAGGAMAHVWPEEHIEENTLQFEFTRDFVDLGKGKGPVFLVIGTAEAVAVALLPHTHRLPLIVDHPPGGVGVVGPGVIDQAVITHHAHALSVAQVNKPLDFGIVLIHGGMGVTRGRAEVGIAHVTLEIDHGGLDFGKLQILQIGLRGKVPQKFGIPILNMHVRQVAAVAGFVPLHRAVSFS